MLRKRRRRGGRGRARESGRSRKSQSGLASISSRERSREGGWVDNKIDGDNSPSRKGLA